MVCKRFRTFYYLYLFVLVPWYLAALGSALDAAFPKKTRLLKNLKRSFSESNPESIVVQPAAAGEVLPENSAPALYPERSAEGCNIENPAQREIEGHVSAKSSSLNAQRNNIIDTSPDSAVQSMISPPREDPSPFEPKQPSADENSGGSSPSNQFAHISSARLVPYSPAGPSAQAAGGSAAPQHVDISGENGSVGGRGHIVRSQSCQPADRGVRLRSDPTPQATPSSEDVSSPKGASSLPADDLISQPTSTDDGCALHTVTSKKSKRRHSKPKASALDTQRKILSEQRRQLGVSDETGASGDTMRSSPIVGAKSDAPEFLTQQVSKGEFLQSSDKDIVGHALPIPTHASDSRGSNAFEAQGFPTQVKPCDCKPVDDARSPSGKPFGVDEASRERRELGFVPSPKKISRLSSVSTLNTPHESPDRGNRHAPTALAPTIRRLSTGSKHSASPQKSRVETPPLRSSRHSSGSRGDLPGSLSQLDLADLYRSPSGESITNSNVLCNPNAKEGGEVDRHVSSSDQVDADVGHRTVERVCHVTPGENVDSTFPLVPVSSSENTNFRSNVSGFLPWEKSRDSSQAKLVHDDTTLSGTKKTVFYENNHLPEESHVDNNYCGRGKLVIPLSSGLSPPPRTRLNDLSAAATGSGGDVSHQFTPVCTNRNNPSNRLEDASHECGYATGPSEYQMDFPFSEKISSFLQRVEADADKTPWLSNSDFIDGSAAGIRMQIHPGHAIHKQNDGAAQDSQVSKTGQPLLEQVSTRSHSDVLSKGRDHEEGTVSLRSRIDDVVERELARSLSRLSDRAFSETSIASSMNSRRPSVVSCSDSYVPSNYDSSCEPYTPTCANSAINSSLPSRRRPSETTTSNVFVAPQQHECDRSTSTASSGGTSVLARSWSKESAECGRAVNTSYDGSEKTSMSVLYGSESGETDIDSIILGAEGKCAFISL